MNTPADAFRHVLAAFDRLAVSYLIGGSVASSIRGVSRPTMDVDIVADLNTDQVEPLVAALGPDFYADTEMIREALHRNRAFNLIHIPSTFKIDVFPLGLDDYSREAFSRRTREVSRSFGAPITCSVATAEDTILRKLEWYRAGGETSEKQWNDLRGILRVAGPTLDTAYLLHWASQLHLTSLLDRLLAEPPSSRL